MLAWSQDGDRVIVEQEQGDFYFADPADGSLGQCLTCGLAGALRTNSDPRACSVNASLRWYMG